MRCLSFQFLMLISCVGPFKSALAQDTPYLKVHFLYGSKPMKEFETTEEKWFGGMLGGHVGIEGDSDQIVNFLPKGKFHWIAKSQLMHSTYAEHSFDNFYAILGGNPDSVKKMIVYIPVTVQQKATFDSITKVYLQQSPYDYALFGMRCGAAAYDILSQMGIFPNYSRKRIAAKIFYPKKLRKRLIKKAAEEQWQVETSNGSSTRKWEKD